MSPVVSYVIGGGSRLSRAAFAFLCHRDFGPGWYSCHRVGFRAMRRT